MSYKVRCNLAARCVKSQNAVLLVDCWMGHENREMGTRYAKQLIEEVAWRKQWAKKVGLGFKLSDLQFEIGQPPPPRT